MEISCMLLKCHRPETNAAILSYKLIPLTKILILKALYKLSSVSMGMKKIF